MKEKTKEFLKRYLIGFILGFVSVGIVVVYAETYFPSNDVTYDNTESGLSSSDVQGAIDELYGVCFPPKAGEQIIEDAELEKDPYECRYFFTGANPNNYITFNDETAGWRIISVECDGTIKIIKNNSIGNMAWDTNNGQNWSTSTLNLYLNNNYYSSLNSAAQSQIVAKDWSIGAVTYGDSDLTNTINNENNTKWNGKVALVTVSEYIRSNSNKNSCGTVSSYNNSSNCVNTGWMDTNYSWWTLIKRTDWFTVFCIAYDGSFGAKNNVNYVNNLLEIRPVVYLSSEITLTGSGTQDDPYVLS